MNTTQKVSFSFSKLRYGPFGLNPENFANIWQIKWKWIRSMKFETVRIYFLLSSKNVATMATWRNDFSSLLLRNFQFVISEKAEEEGRGSLKDWRGLDNFSPLKREGAYWKRGALHSLSGIQYDTTCETGNIAYWTKTLTMSPQWERKRRYTVSNEISRRNCCTLLERIYTFPDKQRPIIPDSDRINPHTQTTIDLLCI